MDFSFPEVEPNITEEYLLSKNSEETYMQTYLGVSVRKGLIISPLRNDHRPTASFYRNKNNELIFHDFGTGFHGNFIDIVKFKYNCTYRQALNIIAEDFNFIPSSKNRKPIKIKTTDTVIEEKQETSVQIEKQDFLESELKWWKSFGISLDTLNKFKVFSVKNVFINGEYRWSSSTLSPIFGYYGGKKGNIELWRLYHPRKQQYRFISNWPANMLQGIKMLPSNGDLVVITKSMKDVMLFYELGIPAIAPCSEVLFITPQQLTRLKQRFKKIIVCYDNDATGISFMRKIKKKYPELLYFFIPRKYKCKDPSDYYKKYGKEDIQEKIKQIREFYGC